MLGGHGTPKGLCRRAGQALAALILNPIPQSSSMSPSAALQRVATCRSSLSPWWSKLRLAQPSVSANFRQWPRSGPVGTWVSPICSSCSPWGCLSHCLYPASSAALATRWSLATGTSNPHGHLHVHVHTCLSAALQRAQALPPVPQAMAAASVIFAFCEFGTRGPSGSHILTAFCTLWLASLLPTTSTLTSLRFYFCSEHSCTPTHPRVMFPPLAQDGWFSYLLSTVL